MNKILIMVISGTLALAACSKKTDAAATDGAESNSNISESAVSEGGQQSTSAEGASSPTLMSDDLSLDIRSMDFVDPQDKVNPLAACTFSAARSTCTSNVSTVNWNGCTVGLATLSGGWTEAWSAGFCANGVQPTALTNTNSVTRTSSGQVLILASGARLTTDTAAHTTYDGTSIPATGVTVSMAGGTRTVVVNGLHKVMVGPRGRAWFDHSITSPGLSVTGSRATSNRVISGTSTMFHNLASYKAVHTFNSVTWGSSSCCYPTSGSISTVLTGSRSGSVSLTFSSTCGTATFTDTDSTSSTLALTQCN